MVTAIVSLCLLATSFSSADFVVSPNGSDASPGNSAHPFRSIERARDAVRSLRRDHADLQRPIVVTLTPGIYQLDHAWQLTSEDSGTEKSPTIYQGNHSTISGGRVLNGFKIDSHGWWTLNLPEVKAGAWRFSQLFVDGHRRYRPRLPKRGYSTITAEAPPSESAKGHGFDRFYVHPGDINPSWHNLRDVELLCFHIWDMSRMRIGTFDSATNLVTTTGPTGYDAGWATFPVGGRYIAENVKEALSDPGEWYLDTTSGDLTYIPMPGETPEKCAVVAPTISQLLDMQGGQGGRFVENVQFKDLSFAYTNWNLDPKGRFFPQAEIDLGAAINIDGARKCSFTRCDIAHTGEYAMGFQKSSRGVIVDNANMTDLGAGGVKIGETRLYDQEADCAGEITIQNSDIAHAGRLHPAAIGVWIGQSAHNTIQNNRIYDMYYTGVSIGWTWGYGASQAHHNRIAFNEISDIGQAVLSDMGGIYTLGIEPGTEIIGNVIHDVDSFSYGGWGIYPDEGSSNELITQNLVFRTKSGAFHQHYGRENVVRNNIFAFAREAEVIRTRAEDHLSFTFENNIVYWKDAPLLGSNWSGNNYCLDKNLYWRTDSKPVEFAGLSLDAWRAKGQDVHSKVENPLFVNAEAGDFRLKSNSPAFSLGFVPFLPQKGNGGRSKWPARTNEPPAFPNNGLPLSRAVWH